MDQYPNIQSYLARRALRYLPSTFAKEEGTFQKAAIFSVADYLLHMSAILSKEIVDWKPVTGLAIVRNMPHMLALGWRFGAEDEPAILFQESHVHAAIKWLKKYGYIETSYSGLDEEGEYQPTPKLVAEFASVLGIAQK